MSALTPPGGSELGRVGLARTEPSYAGLVAPFGPGPGCTYPELAALADGVGNESPGGPANHVYAAVRAALAAAGLDQERFGAADWNPLASLVEPGARIVLKPNFIRHWNPCDNGTLDSVVTHGAVLRAMADYAWLAAGEAGSVAIAEAPQHDCDWAVVAAHAGIEQLVRHYARCGRRLEVIDLRREAVRYADGVVVERWPLPGDPAGYRLVDLGAHSAFHDSGLDPVRFRGADYDAQPTADHHTGGRHEYLVSETVLSSDLVVNLPKIKTHKKTGVTLALKNLVGINGDKNLLPHHCVGSVDDGGDEFPGLSPLDRTRSAATEVARRLLRRGIGTRLVRWVRRVEDSARGSDFVRSGNWHGNRTTWRMCLDLNRVLYYSDRKGAHFDAPAPVRKVLSVIDGIVAGEGEGPLAPSDRPLGVVLASLDPIALDLVAIRLMGFDETRIPKVWETMRTSGLRLSALRDAADVDLREVGPDGVGICALALADLTALADLDEGRGFVAHSGWRGQLERLVSSPGPVGPAGPEAAPCAG